MTRESLVRFLYRLLQCHLCEESGRFIQIRNGMEDGCVRKRKRMIPSAGLPFPAFTESLPKEFIIFSMFMILREFCWAEESVAAKTFRMKCRNIFRILRRRWKKLQGQKLLFRM